MNQPNREELFDDWAERYDRSVRRGGFPLEGYEQVLDQVVEAADVTAGMTVLDLGTGTGNLAARFVDLGCQVWGLDFSAAMLAKARQKVPQATLVRAGLLDEWPAELDRRFERIVSGYALHHLDLEAKVALLDGMSRQYLAPEGRIVVGDVSFPTVAAREQAHQERIERWDEDEWYWAADETKRACGQFGLELTYTQVSSCGGVYVIMPVPSGEGS
jgi:putative AdoMet-dependent methyltransferase